MKIMVVVGARPNFMKAAPIVFAIRKHNEQSDGDSRIRCLLVHTGQHYDEAMSGSFFSDLSLPSPDIQLDVGSGSHAAQTAEIMKRFEGVLLRERPDVVVVVGDVNSTLACALVTSKIAFDSQGTRPLIAHVEAGLRSFDSRMPEEINRIMTDHLSDLLFVTEESGMLNLEREGVSAEKIHFVGNTMIDSLMASLPRAEQSSIHDRLGLNRSEGLEARRSRYVLLTLHRPSNVDGRETLVSILHGVKQISEVHPVLFLAHPRTRKRIEEFGLESFFCRRGEGTVTPIAGPGIYMLDPIGYLDFLCLMKHAALVVTDSGGVQEETTCLAVPCVTVRENTERPVTVQCGTNRVAGTQAENIRRAIREQISKPGQPQIPEKWDGKAAGRLLEIIVERLGATPSSPSQAAESIRVPDSISK